MLVLFAKALEKIEELNMVSFLQMEAEKKASFFVSISNKYSAFTGLWGSIVLRVAIVSELANSIQYTNA